MRKLLINNDILISQKQYNLTQSKALYELTYKIKMLRKFEEEEDNLILEISLDEMKGLVGNPKYSEKQLVERIMKGELLRKDITILIDDYNALTWLPAFRMATYYKEEKCFRFKFNDDYLELVEQLNGSFAEMLLNEYSSLSSAYSQRMYELYCKFKNQKFYSMPIEHLRLFFSVPACYNTGNIDQKIVNKAIKEIKESTNGNVDIKVSKIKKGKEVTHYKFIF